MIAGIPVFKTMVLNEVLRTGSGLDPFPLSPLKVNNAPLPQKVYKRFSKKSLPLSSTRIKAGKSLTVIS